MADHDKVVNDDIFGFISLKPHILAIIDTPEFQRLRWIWQLGATPFVYPTANHCRFEHSIGTYHLASRLITKLQSQLEKDDSEIKINENDVKCVEIAALCHDIGHGPFSHLWDNTILPKIIAVDKVKKDFQMSAIILDEWQKNEKIKNIFKDLNLKLIKDIIVGRFVSSDFQNFCERDKKKFSMLITIVNNADSGLDVDKFDYLARDSVHLGHATTHYSIDIDRMINSARAIKDDHNTWTIAFPIKESVNLLRVFQLRHSLYKCAYRHRKVVAIEQMMIDGFKEYFGAHRDVIQFIEHFFVAENLEECEKNKYLAWFNKSNDSIFYANVAEISCFQKILNRDIYRLIFETRMHKLTANPEEEILTMLRNDEKLKHALEHVRFAFDKFRLDSATSNPMLSIPFFRNNNAECFKYTQDSIPQDLHYVVDESRILVFSTVEEGSVKNGYDERSLITAFKSYFEGVNFKESEEINKWKFDC